ncbi:transcriptional regulator [Actinokineospora soli]|uniref:Transcriptional regulator n=1 Tax=Actinokineospora soli TaxID=1048753 RepID=A0ABW2TQ16_9PSEU
MRVQDHPGRPFAAAFDAAIAARGLTLDRIRRHLADHGIAVSTATLSYWRRDLRQPENERSLRAVAVLEELLGLRPATLTGLIAPRAPAAAGRVEPSSRTSRRSSPRSPCPVRGGGPWCRRTTCSRCRRTARKAVSARGS